MIGIYGGSFDPVHLGHIRVARYLLETGGLQRILLMPAFEHPLGKSLTPFEHRWQMLERATMSHPDIELSDLERELGGVSYTIELLRALDDRFGTGMYCFIAGMDNLNTFFLWKEWQEVIRNWNILFTTRAEMEAEQDTLNELSRAAGRPIPDLAVIPRDFSGPGIFRVPDWPIASRIIRKMLLNGKSPSDMMDSKVLDYINDQHLYKNGEVRMDLLATITGAGEEKKAENISVLKVTELTTIADHFVIMNGTSRTQNQAIADEILRQVKQKPLSMEGYDLAEWILIDFGEVIVHVFSEEKRAFYNLESLWADAEKLIRRNER